jgi:hypothetical protein
VERAEQLLAGELELLGRRWKLPPCGVSWNQDPVSGQTFSSAPFPRTPCGGDPKHPWALGRLDALLFLGQGAWASDSPALREAAAVRFRSLTLDFLEANPAGRGVQWSCAMEVSLRAANLAQSLLLFGDAPTVGGDAPFQNRVLTALGEHADFVLCHLEDDGAVPNNHLVADQVGLSVVAALFPELPRASLWGERARCAVRAELLTQVHPDGVSFEGSLPYHRLATELFTLAYLQDRDHAHPWPAPELERLGQMYDVATATLSASGTAPQIGDNDSGRALPLRPRASLDWSYLPPLGAALLGRSLHRGEFPDEAAWLLGAEGLAIHEALPKVGEPEPFLSRRGGVAVLRAPGVLVAASVGRSGQRGIGGHSHNDKLSFELHVDGRPTLVDPGTLTYLAAPWVRNRLRSTESHNVLQVDSDEQSPLPARRLFALPDQSACEVSVWQVGGRVLRLGAQHAGFSTGSVHRTFLLDRDARALCLWDRVEGAGLHRLMLRLHLPDQEARLMPLAEEERARALAVCQAPRALAPLAVQLGPEDAPRAWLVFEAGLVPEISPWLYSRGYGECQDAWRVVVAVQRVLPAVLRMVVLLRSQAVPFLK